MKGAYRFKKFDDALSQKLCLIGCTGLKSLVNTMKDHVLKGHFLRNMKEISNKARSFGHF